MKTDKLDATQRDVAQSIIDRHKTAGSVMHEMLDNILDTRLTESQKRNSDELDRLLQGG